MVTLARKIQQLARDEAFTRLRMAHGKEWEHYHAQAMARLREKHGYVDGRSTPERRELARKIRLGGSK